jgi:hypothetical protein
LSDARAHYQEKLAALSGHSDALAKQDKRFSQIRVAVFVFAAALLFIGYAISPQRAPWTIMGWVGMLAFLVVITWHEFIRLRLWENEKRSGLYRRLLARLERQWDQLPVVLSRVPSKFQGLADDLDVQGRASLMHWLCFAETQPARQLLIDWIFEEPDVAEIQKRQEAVCFYADRVELRERVYCLSSEVAGSTASPERFVEWATSAPWLGSKKWLFWCSWGGIALLLLGLVLSLLSGASILPLEWGLGFLITGVVWNVLLSVGYGSHLHEIFQRISSRHQDVEKYQELLELVTREGVAVEVNKGKNTAEKNGAVPQLVSKLREQLQAGGNAELAFKSLNWRIGLAGIRHSPLFFIPYLALQILLAWDFRTLSILEYWQQRYGSGTKHWFAALAQFETICSIAAVRFEHPDWCLPTWIESSEKKLVAHQLGHPLLRDSQRVTNDIAIDSEKPLWLITGSNMSGKSTFLRSLGTNILLARTGSPVCAAKMELPPLVLATSIRIRDSLDQGISYFMAELRRLKYVVDIAEEYQGSERFRVLFLLDEIMQGTNSRERHIAVGHVLHTLLSKGAFGAVSTHDLDLVSHPLLEPECEVVHFREHIEKTAEGRRMVFDYKMRNGPTPTTNALRLLALVGLGDLTED